MIRTKLEEVLDKEGVTEIDAEESPSMLRRCRP